MIRLRLESALETTLTRPDGPTHTQLESLRS